MGINDAGIVAHPSSAGCKALVESDLRVLQKPRGYWLSWHAHRRGALVLVRGEVCYEYAGFGGGRKRFCSNRNCNRDLSLSHGA